jgi:hypothetical protein
MRREEGEKGSRRSEGRQKWRDSLPPRSLAIAPLLPHLMGGGQAENRSARMYNILHPLRVSCSARAWRASSASSAPAAPPSAKASSPPPPGPLPRRPAAYQGCAPGFGAAGVAAKAWANSWIVLRSISILTRQSSAITRAGSH